MINPYPFSLLNHLIIPFDIFIPPSHVYINNVTPLNNLSSFNIDSKSNDDNVANINSETVNNNTSTDINSEMMPLNTFNSIGSTNEQNNLDIDSGIDTALEQEIMRTKVENQVKAPIVENNSFFKEPEEKQVYRARRNAPTAMPIWIQEEEKKEQAQIVTPEINLSLNNRRFDFAIMKDNFVIRLIEFDGEQHYRSSGGWNSKENLKITQ